MEEEQISLYAEKWKGCDSYSAYVGEFTLSPILLLPGVCLYYLLYILNKYAANWWAEDTSEGKTVIMGEGKRCSSLDVGHVYVSRLI